MQKYIKASDGSMISFAAKERKTFKPVTASRYGQAPKTVDKYQYHVYCDRGSGMELSAWYDTYEEAKKVAMFLKKKGYDVEIRDTFQEDVNAATDVLSGTYVIVKPAVGRGEPGLFIDSKAIKFSPTQKAYSPNFTSTRANNINRAKKFNSAEEAQAFIDKQANDKDLWKYAPVEVMSFDEAMSLIGDPDKNYEAYKQSQADKRAESRKRYAETAKSQSKKNREKNPGTYKVTFWYSDKSLGNESYIVDAESIDDAFQKAKAKALQQDAYRNQDGYDQKMTFNKQNIRKIEGAEVDIEHNDFDVPVI